MATDIDFLIPGGALLGALSRRLLMGNDQKTEPPAQPGAMIGPFRIVEALGRGGSSWVFRAERADGSFRQQVALKLLSGDKRLGPAMERERRILAGLRHPNIAMIIDGGATTEDTPWFAMELVEGERIDAYCRHRSLDWKARVALVRNVALAVAHAHRHLIVHRDIKPANVLVDDNGVPKLLDFGIAGHADDSPAPGTSDYAFTPEFASPEQRSGATTTAASDIFQCGRLLEILLLDEDCPDLADWPRRDIRAIAAMATRMEPASRHESAALLAQELDQALRGEAVAARRDEPGYLWRWRLRRHRWAIIASTALAASLVGGATLSLWQAHVAKTQAHWAQVEADKARRTKDFVVSILQAGDPEQTANSARSVVDLLRDADARAETELADLPDARAEMHIAIGHSLTSLGHTSEGIGKLERGAALLRTEGAASRLPLARALTTLASRYATSNRLEDAVAASTEARDLFRQVAGDDNLEQLAAVAVLARVAGLRARHDEELALYRDILATRSRQLGHDDSRLTVDWNNLAATALLGDRYDEAEQAYREALRVMVLPPALPRARQVWIHAGLGAVYSHAWRLDDADRSLDTAQAIAAETLPDQHTILASIHVARSRVHWMRGQYEQAREQAQQAIDIFAPANYIELHTAESQLGLALLALHDYPGAQRSFEAAAAHGTSISGEPDATARVALAGAALARMHRGEPDAIIDIERNLAHFDARPASSRRAQLRLLDFLAQAHRINGDLAAVRRLRERELALQIELLGEDSTPVHTLRRTLDAMDADIWRAP